MTNAPRATPRDPTVEVARLRSVLQNLVEATEKEMLERLGGQEPTRATPDESRVIEALKEARRYLASPEP